MVFNLKEGISQSLILEIQESANLGREFLLLEVPSSETRKSATGVALAGTEGYIYCSYLVVCHTSWMDLLIYSTMPLLWGRKSTQDPYQKRIRENRQHLLPKHVQETGLGWKSPGGRLFLSRSSSMPCETKGKTCHI